jgi:hypothetical protein
MSSKTARRRKGTSAVMCLLLAVACDGGPTESSRPGVWNIEIDDGDEQVAVPGSILPRQLRVRVTDSHGRGADRIQVLWIVASGGGVLTPVNVESRTALSGLATAAYTAGPHEGTETVLAIATGVPGAPHARFTATVVTEVVAVAAPDCYLYSWYNVACPPVFTPAEVVVPVGSTVGWSWHHGEACDLLFEDDESEPVSVVTRNSGSHLRTFSEPGTYRFRCSHFALDYDDETAGTVRVE